MITLRKMRWRRMKLRMVGDVKGEEDDDVERDDVEEEDRPQDLGPHFARACAVEIHLVSQEELVRKFYRQNAGAQSEHPDQAQAFTPTIRTPQCGHTAWGKSIYQALPNSSQVYHLHSQLRLLQFGFRVAHGGTRPGISTYPTPVDHWSTSCFRK